MHLDLKSNLEREIIIKSPNLRLVNIVCPSKLEKKTHKYLGIVCTSKCQILKDSLVAWKQGQRK